ncbi:hypothetical protein Q8A73_020690 [Channa argus]|nr:hypothetical protein Q8A73_020690 [Channa argus]
MTRKTPTEMDHMEQIEETLDMEETRQLVDSFLQRLTQEQLEFFRLDKDDSATKVLLSEFLLDLILLLAKCVLMKLNRTTVSVSEEYVLSTVGDTLPQTFTEALNLSNDFYSGSSRSLTSLISLQVARSVNSALSAMSARSARTESTEPVIDLKDTCPGSLNAMVQQASKMIQDSAGKIQAQYASPPDRRRSSISPMSDSSNEYMKDGSETPDNFVYIESSESAEDTLLSTTSKTVEDVLMKEVSDLTEPLLSDMSDEDFAQLETDSLPKIRMVAQDIAESIVDDVKAAETFASPKDKKPKKAKFNKLGKKMKNFFTNQFAQASVFRIMAKVKAKFFDNSQVQSSQSMQDLMSSVESVFHPKDTKTEDAVYECKWVTEISKGKDQMFIENLTGLLGSYTDGLKFIPEPDKTSPGQTLVLVTPPRATIAAYIRERVQLFVGLMNWWQKIQAEALIKRVTKLAVEDTSAAVSVSSQILYKIEKETRDKENMKKMYVMVIVQKLLTRILKNTKIVTTVDEDVIANQLFDCIWAEIQCDEFEISEEALEHFDKQILKELSKTWNSPWEVMVGLISRDPQIEQNIASLFRHHLINGPKK